MGNFLPPLWMKLTARSLSRGCLIVAYSVGMPMEKLICLSNHSDMKVLFRRCFETLTLPNWAARFLFERFLQSNADNFSRE